MNSADTQMQIWHMCGYLKRCGLGVRAQACPAVVCVILHTCVSSCNGCVCAMSFLCVCVYLWKDVGLSCTDIS